MTSTWGRSDTIWACGAALLATVIASLFSHFVFGRIPHVQDSIVQLFQARIFAGGHLVAAAPPIPDFFEYTHMILKDGKWYSQYPPGHPLLLLFGVWTGQPWLVNPILGGCAVFGIYALGHELMERRVARLAAALALVSPFFLLMSAEFMAHASSLAALTLFLVAYLRWVRTGSRLAGAGVVVGLALGMLVRPYSAFGFMLPVLAHAIWIGLRPGAMNTSSSVDTKTASLLPRREPPSSFRRWRAFLACIGGATLGGVLLLAYNAATTGHPLRFGYEELYGADHGLGFGKASWGPPHTLMRGLRGAVSQLRGLDHRLFEWPGSSLWPLLLALLPRLPWEKGRSAGSAERRSIGGAFALRWWLLSFPCSLLFVHVFYWYRDHCFGPRYLYEALGPVLLLTSVGLLRVHEWIAALLRRGSSGGRARGSRVTKPREPRAPSVASVASSVSNASNASSASVASFPSIASVVSLSLLVLLVASGLVFRWPLLFRIPEEARGQGPESPYRQASYFQYFGREYWAVGPRLGEIVEASVDATLPRSEGQGAIVFVRMTEPPIDELSVRHLWFGSAFARQEPFWERARVIYAKDLGARNEELLRAFPDRAVFAYVGSVQGGEVRRLR